MAYEEIFDRWLKGAVADPDLIPELEAVRGKEDEIADRFYTDLEFGTAGLRGVIGAGTNRMNVYTVGKATQGLASFLGTVTEKGKVAIGYDSRRKSRLFAETAAAILAANGIHVYLYPELAPVPMTSFATRYYGCNAGIMVTASHNPAKYNGYKVYGPDGCQLGVAESDRVLSFMNEIDVFTDIKFGDFTKSLAAGDIEYIGEKTVNAYLDAVRAQSVCPDAAKGSDFRVIYSPLHGAGNKPVRAILAQLGMNVTVVPEQEQPDGEFPTVPFPNPEFREAFDCAIKLAETVPADLLLATDPDCDRVGIAVKNGDGYRLFTGNEVGAMLLNYILSVKTERGTLEKDPIAVKTIVTTDMCLPIAAKYGCRMIDVLTGFKYIGEQIALLEEKGEEARYQLGFEESYGYLKGGYVRDKDGVVASMLICEMACYYKKKGKTLIEVYADLEKEFGFYRNSQESFYFEGQDGMAKMAGMMDRLAAEFPKTAAGMRLTAVGDYRRRVETDLAAGKETPITLPKANVLCFRYENGNSVIVRPSGTEPKIKIYVTATAESGEKADAIRAALTADFKKILGV